jgi:5'-3' exonuclease
MGIPSYFSHFVRQHRRIIKQISHSKSINNLYLDCNSFIYDAVNSDRTNTNEDIIIKYVCDKLIYYINLLKPNKNVFIAFDGVAPVAKLNQQRKRRYLSWFQSHNIQEPQEPQDKQDKQEQNWNTAAITPGTQFMSTLAREIKARFNNPKEFRLEKFIISCADEVGEGEHKLFQFIRANKQYHADTNTVIYGLDADLIMLTLSHLHISDNLYLFRETPEFIKSIDNTLNPNELYLLDIPEFGKSIIKDLSSDNNINKINDYIFIFFFLGNDFMPHFPSLNIRTNGIELLLNAYKLILNSKNLHLTVDGKIQWKNLRLLVEYLSANELTYIKQAYMLREKQSINTNKNKNNKQLSKEKELENQVLNLPTTDRATEQYINPMETGWEARYYKSLFDIRIESIRNECQRRKEICQNYLEGLEWTFKYYNSDCVDWHWTYKYDYPPLLVDLLKYIPYFDNITLINNTLINNKKCPVSPFVQLSYVLPKQSLNLLPIQLRENLLQMKPEWYVDNCEFQWAFCKYFWEAHVKLPDIDIQELECIIIKSI